MRKCRLMKNLDKVTFADAEQLMIILTNKYDDMSFKEPIYDGETHDNWEEKIDALDEIVEKLNESIDTEDEDLFFEAVDDIEDFQLWYSGLGNLSIQLSA